MIMADGNELSENKDEIYRNRLSDTESDHDDHFPSLQLDLGDELSRNMNRLGGANNSGSCLNEVPRREDNPFSFKHFLRSSSNDSSSNYQNKGARPKVFCEGRPYDAANDAKQPPSRLGPEYSSALPDFVQDHLVIEQCYLGGGSNNSASFNLDVNNLPDFAPTRDQPANRILNNSDSSHNNQHVSNPRPHSTNNHSNNDMPLDLPIRPPQSAFPLDLPITNGGSRSCPPSSEVGVSKSLPDFLADGAVRSSQNSLDGSLESPERECDRLRRELETVRGQLAEQARRVETLQRELEISRNKEHDYTQNLAKALEQVEENLERSNMRSNSAENTILKLRQDIKSLDLQVQHLKQENRMLRGEEGAAGGHDYYPPNELQAQRLAKELNAAASTAEHSLRQLLTGVDNLRIMAASLESLHRVEERRETFLDLDEDNSSGPAL